MKDLLYDACTKSKPLPASFDYAKCLKEIILDIFDEGVEGAQEPFYLEWKSLRELNYKRDIHAFSKASDDQIIEFTINAHAVLISAENNEDKYNILVLASLSLGRILAQGHKFASKWLNSDIFYIIDNFFNEPVKSRHKKLALDLAVVAITDIVDFKDRVLGFNAPLKKKDYFVLKVTMKLLESFCVSTPTHYPFMPEPFFEGVQWPLIKESCPGKVHSLFVFSKPTDDNNDSNNSPSALTPQELNQFCACEYVYRRQPWVHYFSSSQLLALGKVVIDTHNYDCISTDIGYNALMDRQYCQKILNLLRNVFRRIVEIDTSLVHRDKKKQCPFQMLSECSICYCKVAPFIRRYSVFSRGSSSGHSKSFSTSSVGKGSFAAMNNSQSSPSIAESSEHNLASALANQASLTREMNNSQSIKVSGTKDAIREFPRHHCRLCFQTICDSCTAPDTWMSERICTSCLTILHAVDLISTSSISSSGKKSSNISVIEGGGKQNRVYSKSNKSIKSPGPEVKEAQEKQAGAAKKFKWFLFGKSEESVCNDLLDEIDLCCSLILADELIKWRDDGYPDSTFVSTATTTPPAVSTADGGGK